MEIPDRVQALVLLLGQRVMQALAEDAKLRALSLAVRQEGFDVAVVADATVVLRALDPEAPEIASDLDGDSGDPPGEPSSAPSESARPTEPEPAPWSEEDRAFLHRFKISLDGP